MRRIYLMANKKGMLILFSGPSGVGKDTVLSVVLDKDKSLQKSVSLTTRGIRENEIDGIDYYFISTLEFEHMINNGEVLEFAKYGINLYGTPKAPVDKWLSEGKTVFLKIEVQGAQKIKEMYPDSVAIFLMPPSMEELENRLRSRGTESEEDIRRRMQIARDEIKKSADYDYVVFNDDLDSASDNVLAIIKALDFTYKRMKNYISEVIKDV
ncbi:MAG: guanylate kinase [Oscillospiraceae bacterium]|nr:guanylate kinase [Oscillospiraceae bacterium]